MALFDGAKVIPGSRSHSRLVVSEGMSPAERWVVDPALPPLFEYHYGGPGFVAIPKGTIVGIGDHIKDYETGKMVNVVTIANGTTVNPVGVAPYNIYQRVTGRLYHNQPSIITRDYIEVPLMQAIGDVYHSGAVSREAHNLKMKWGCAYGALKAGDYVTTDGAGKFVRLNAAGANFDKVVGQVLAVETDMPPTGWLKWLSWANETGDRVDDNNTLPFPIDPATGRPYSPDYKWPLKADPHGIPGMTDGGQMGRLRVTAEALGTVPKTGTPAGSTLVFRLLKKPIFEDSIVLKVDGVVVQDFQVDYSAGFIYYVVKAGDIAQGVTPAKVVTADYDFHDLSKLGVPSSWDFQGSIGAARILLKL